VQVSGAGEVLSAVIGEFGRGIVGAVPQLATVALFILIADTVAGVYRLRDPDFNAGDIVETATVTGIIEGVDLRKARIREETGNLVVVSNRDVEKRWTRTGEP
jgi:small-conductance mechanosensitive channel